MRTAIGAAAALLGSFGEFQRYGIHAVAQARWLRTVVKDVPEVCVASAAGNRGALHAQAIVRSLQDILFGDRRPKAGPTRAGFELGDGTEKSRVAADAAEHALIMNIQKLARERPLRFGVASYLKRGGRQLRFPLGFGFLNHRDGNCSLALAGVGELNDGDLLRRTGGRGIGMSRRGSSVVPSCSARERGAS